MRNDIMIDMTIGLSDGLVVPFALAAALSMTHVSNEVITSAGLAATGAGALAMALSAYFTNKEERRLLYDEFQSRFETLQQTPAEKNKMIDLFADLGLNPETQQKLAAEMAEEKRTWIEFMQANESAVRETDPLHASRSAMTIAFSYLTGGLVPLLSYFFIASSREAFYVSALITLPSLFLAGYMKGRSTGANPWQSAFLLTFIGAAATAAAMAVARIIVTAA